MQAAQQKQAELQWKLFADLDTQDEAEKLNLAVFMQTLISSVPNQGSRASDLRNRNDSLGFNRETIVFQDLELDNDNEYFIQSNDIGVKIASEVIDFCRKGGTHKVSKSAVTKILKKSYKIFMAQSNVHHITIPEGTKLTVVGDLHGQLSDLLHILDHAGLPGPQHKYIFNGDFVDRGTESVEVIVIIFSLLVAYGPDTVYLNRGNHEDIAICRVYGFEAEVQAKYDKLIFEMFTETFNYIPLATIVNDSIFVVHGGLFHKANVPIKDIDEIMRHDFLLKPKVPYPKNAVGLSAELQRKEYLKQLQRECLWSDPAMKLGATPNARGAGANFGPDIAAGFMSLNNIDMVVRSHEVVCSGFGMPFASFLKNIDPSLGFRYSKEVDFQPGGSPLLCTLFSASNYSGSNNEAAIMTFERTTVAGPKSRPIGGKSDLSFTVHHFKTSHADSSSMKSFNIVSLQDLILRRRSTLFIEFELADNMKNGLVTFEQWAKIMQTVTQISVDWQAMISTVVISDALTIKGKISYIIFLNSFTLGDDEDSKRLGESKINVFDDMYGQREKLEAVFTFFDTNGDGVSNIIDIKEE